MRVLIISQMYPRRDAPTYGEFIHRQARALAAAGADVTVVAPMMHAPWFTWWRRRWAAFRHVPVNGWRDGVRVYRPRYVSPPGMRFHYLEGGTMRRGMRELCDRLHAEAPFDIVHANRLFPEGLAALSFQRRWNVPVVAMARGMDLNLIPGWGKVYRKQLRHVAAQADGILSVSQALLDDLHTFASPPAFARVVYNGCEVSVLAPTPDERLAIRREFGLPPDKLLALYVGRLEPDKGTPELLRSMGAVIRRHPGLHLVAAGQVRRAGYLTDVERAGWSEQAHFLGERRHADIQRLMRACDLFVFPSRLEGVPNAVLEAMGNGLPVVATRAGGIPEIVPPEAGMLVDVGDVHGLETSVEALVESPSRRKAMGTAGRAHVSAGFLWCRNARQLLAAYEEVIQMRSRNSQEQRHVAGA